MRREKCIMSFSVLLLVMTIPMEVMAEQSLEVILFFFSWTPTNCTVL